MWSENIYFCNFSIGLIYVILQVCRQVLIINTYYTRKLNKDDHEKNIIMIHKTTIDLDN